MQISQKFTLLSIYIESTYEKTAFISYYIQTFLKIVR